MSLFAEYKLEREAIETIETPVSFATYRQVGDDTLYIQDIFVAKDARKSGAASHLADQIAEIAKGKGLKYLLGSVDTRLGNPTTSTKVLLAYGFEVSRVEGQLILFRKEI